MSVILGFHLPKLKTFYETIAQIQNYKGLINCGQIFVGSPKSSGKSHLTDADAAATKKYITEHDIPIFIHASYIMNLSKIGFSAKILNGELGYSMRLGTEGVVVHCGKATGISAEKARDNMLYNIKRSIHNYPKGTIIIETSSGQGNEILSNIEDLALFYKRFSSKEKKRIKFCIDTCHIFAAGYDINTREGAKHFLKKLWARLIGGPKTIALIHLNDSYGLLGSHIDRHAPLNEGHISMDGLGVFIRYAFLNEIPMILERKTSINIPEAKKVYRVIYKK